MSGPPDIRKAASAGGGLREAGIVQQNEIKNAITELNAQAIWHQGETGRVYRSLLTPPEQAAFRLGITGTRFSSDLDRPPAVLRAFHAGQDHHESLGLDKKKKKLHEMRCQRAGLVVSS
jgi:hypothetical protein